MHKFSKWVATGVLAVAFVAVSNAGLDVPALSSRPGAAYTLYLNYGGFNYTGTWGGGTPGNVPPLDTDGNTSSFSPSELGIVRDSWARVAQKYVAFDINVTTVDPAVAAGRAGSDSDRQTYYDQTARLMQTIIGGSNSWYSSGAGGVSYIGTTQDANVDPGLHTNWAFSTSLGNNPKYIGEAVSHEQGHGLSLDHQSDSRNGNEYSTNGGASGNGSFAPTVGVGYYSQRSLWRIGASGSGTQNDVDTLLTNDGMSLLDDGVGHTRQTATQLALSGSAVDFTRAQGFIAPRLASGATSYEAIGESNYTSDFFRFSTGGGAVSLTLNDGTQFLTPGVADPGPTFAGTLRVLDASGNVVGTGANDATTLKQTFTGSLSAGDYYVQVASVGGFTSTYETDAKYYTTGGYFLTGNVAPVPEPASMLALGLGLAALARKRRRRN